MAQFCAESWILRSTALAQSESTLDEAQQKQANSVFNGGVNQGKRPIVFSNRLQLEAFRNYVKGWEVNVLRKQPRLGRCKLVD